MDDNALDKVIMACTAAGVGAILVCSFVIPVFVNMLATLVVQEGTPGEEGYVPGYDPAFAGDLELWSTMLSIVVLMVILGFIIAIVRNMTSRGERRWNQTRYKNG